MSSRKRVKDDTPPPVEKAKSHYVVFDLDGTLAEDTFPKPHIGRPIDKGVRWLRHYAEAGHAITIYTARPESHATNIWNWLGEHGLDEFVYHVVCGKPLAGLYVDDRAVRFERDEASVSDEAILRVYNHKEACCLTKTGVCTCRER